jgi:hypothetical protein
MIKFVNCVFFLISFGGVFMELLAIDQPIFGGIPDLNIGKSPQEAYIRQQAQ